MSEQFEKLFKHLADGMSRRAALRRFVGGIAGAAAFSLMGRPVRASRSGCGNHCAKRAEQEVDKDRSQGFVRACMEASSTCPDGFCADTGDLSWEGPSNDPDEGHLYFNTFVCVPVD